mmetsp:Transcript_2812/g.9673  ORF Transcript_2812/g.9673 Transcript_2812/m.9673 type:complete len:203 (-) Transcript_2812:37-645(-)
MSRARTSPPSTSLTSWRSACAGAGQKVTAKPFLPGALHLSHTALTTSSVAPAYAWRLKQLLRTFSFSGACMKPSRRTAEAISRSVPAFEHFRQASKTKKAFRSTVGEAGHETRSPTYSIAAERQCFRTRSCLSSPQTSLPTASELKTVGEPTRSSSSTTSPSGARSPPLGSRGVSASAAPGPGAIAVAMAWQACRSMSVIAS